MLHVTPEHGDLDLTGTSLVVGLGVSGLSMVRALTALGAERVVAVDSRAEPPGAARCRAEHPQVQLRTGAFDTASFTDASRILLSPGVPVSTPEVAEAAHRGVPIWGDIELFARLATRPVAAITGTNGKSTVTSLLGAMARAAGCEVAVGGNLGPAALDLWLETEHAGRPPRLYVLELSSFQLETTASLEPRVATVLNIDPDHLDRYPSVTEYAAAKARIFHGEGAMVINGDDPVVRMMAREGRDIRRFTLEVPGEREYGVARIDDAPWLVRGREPLMPVAGMAIQGRHNQANALAAWAMGDVLGLPHAAMRRALAEFAGLAHRCQLVAEYGGVRWYDDSKGTNVGATVAAVSGLPGPLILIAGGDGKGQDFTPLAHCLTGKVRTLVLIGRDATRIAEAVAGRVPLHWARDMDEAVASAARLAQPGDSVLLSPACASWDMYRDYEERGQVFVAAVRSRLP